ncbi:MAG: ceramidase domain-containing protein [Pseudomonadota bacterium]|nr:ceramidase domain-containing protein [Pseudomonadota bacterium]
MDNKPFIDLYCERTLDGLFAEPLNLFSNLMFFIVFFALRRRWQANAQILLYLILAIAIGSTLFHAFARVWALVLDVGSIALFMVVYFIAYLDQVLGWSKMRTAVFTTIFIVLTTVLRLVHIDGLNYSEFYLSPLVVITLFMWHQQRAKLTGARDLQLALISFGSALFFRIADAHICEYFPAGTHFLWHVCNGLCLYFAMTAYLKSRITQLESQS